MDPGGGGWIAGETAECAGKLAKCGGGWIAGEAAESAARAGEPAASAARDGSVSTAVEPAEAPNEPAESARAGEPAESARAGEPAESARASEPAEPAEHTASWEVRFLVAFIESELTIHDFNTHFD